MGRGAIEADVAEGARPRNEDDLVRIKRALAIWKEGDDPRGTLAEQYLRQHRGLELPTAICGDVLRFHPVCAWRDENTGRTDRHPALIAASRSASWQRTSSRPRQQGGRRLNCPMGTSMSMKAARPLLATSRVRGEGLHRNQWNNPMHLDMHQAKRCRARTRRGTECQSPAMKNGRCRMHGGTSPGAPRGKK
jgi:hypothetical protein